MHRSVTMAMPITPTDAVCLLDTCRREKKKAAIDFMNLRPIPPGAFDLATRKDQICLKTSTPKNTLLPEDLHYKACPHLRPLQDLAAPRMMWNSSSCRLSGSLLAPKYLRQACAPTLLTSTLCCHLVSTFNPTLRNPFRAVAEIRCGLQATDLAHFFLRPKEVISTRLLEQAAASSAERSGDNDGQYSDYGGDGGESWPLVLRRHMQDLHVHTTAAVGTMNRGTTPARWKRQPHCHS